MLTMEKQFSSSHRTVRLIRGGKKKNIDLSYLTGKLELTMYDFSQPFMFAKQNKQKARFILLLIIFTEDIFLKLLSTDAHFTCLL